MRIHSPLITGSAENTNIVTTTRITSLSALSASYAATASYWSGSIINAATASYLLGQSPTSSYALTASYVVTAQTASYVQTAQTASYALTASYANNFTVGGTLTAQTINVQTITSSIDYVTGSAKFGSLSTNTHQFTGSVLVTGSITATSTITASSFSGAGTGLTGTASSLTASAVSSITGNTGLMTDRLTPSGLIDGLTTGNFRSTLFGTTTNAAAIATARWNTAPSVVSPVGAYSTMIAWGASDTQGFLAVDYNGANAKIGGGNANAINWTATLLHSSNYTSYAMAGAGYSANQNLNTSNSPTFAGLTINGAITATGDITGFYSSDKRLKENIRIIPNALQKIEQLNGVTWEWNDDVNEITKSTPNTGLIAQEVQLVLPEVIKEREDGFLALDYSKMMGLMVEAIKDLKKEIEELKK